LKVQQNAGVAWKRLFAAWVLAVAATLAPWTSEPGSRVANGASTIDPALVAELGDLIEDQRGKSPDAASGSRQDKAYSRIAGLNSAAPLTRNPHPPRNARGVLRTHAARSGLTRAPPAA